jgi:hypothetical protein
MFSIAFPQIGHFDPKNTLGSIIVNLNFADNF